MLTKEEKLQVINSHKKGLMYTKYNLEIDALSENARPQPNAETISSIDERIEEVEGQLAALDAELARVNALTEQDNQVSEKAELVVAALQQRIGELVSNYETQIAILRAEITQLVQERDAKNAAVQEYSAELNNLTN